MPVQEQTTPAPSEVGREMLVNGRFWRCGVLGFAVLCFWFGTTEIGGFGLGVCVLESLISFDL